MVRVVSTPWETGVSIIKKSGKAMDEAMHEAMYEQVQQAARKSARKARSVFGPSYSSVGSRIAGTIRVTKTGTRTVSMDMGGGGQFSGGLSYNRAANVWMWGSYQLPRKPKGRGKKKSGRGRHMQQVPPKSSTGVANFGWDEMVEVADLFTGGNGLKKKWGKAAALDGLDSELIKG